MNLDEYISETISIIGTHKQDIDEFALTSDLKQYILNESEEFSKIQQIEIKEAVDSVLKSLGTPEQFAKKVLSEIRNEKIYLFGKILIASFFAFFPMVILIYFWFQ